MLKVTAGTLNAIERGSGVIFKAKIFFQEPEIYTPEDYLNDVGAIASRMSSEGSYEIANTTIELKNTGYYFSERFKDELPVDKLVIIYMTVNSEDIEVFRGIVSGWSLEGTLIKLTINA